MKQHPLHYNPPRLDRYGFPIPGSIDQTITLYANSDSPEEFVATIKHITNWMSYILFHNKQSLIEFVEQSFKDNQFNGINDLSDFCEEMNKLLAPMVSSFIDEVNMRNQRNVEQNYKEESEFAQKAEEERNKMLSKQQIENQKFSMAMQERAKKKREIGIED